MAAAGAGERPGAARPTRPGRAAAGPGTTLIVGCGALAREILDLLDRTGAAEPAGGPPPVRLICLPAKLHNRPERLPAALDRAIRAGRAAGHDRILVAYADCGTGGGIDRVCAAHGVERLPGPHCYATFAARPVFDALMDEEPGSFFLTDYLVRHFDALIVKGLQLDRHPALLGLFFGNYRRVVYLAQSDDSDLRARAAAAAARLGLDLEVRATGMGELAGFVARAVEPVDEPAPAVLAAE